MQVLIVKISMLFSVVLTLFSTSLAVGAETKKIRLGILQRGSQDLVHVLMEQQKILQRHNIPYERITILSPPSLNLMIVEKKVDLGYGSLVALARARSEGKGMLIIHGIFSPVNVVLVPKGSPLKSVADLKGKKVGNFGGPGSTTTTMFLAIAKKWYGIDLRREAELVTAPGPALIGLLDRGELAAALVGTVESLRFPLTGKYRVLLDLSGEWEKRAGRAPAHVLMGTNEEFARVHGDLLKRYIRAYRDTLKYMNSHPQVWENYAKRIKLPPEQGVRVLKEKMAPRILEKWDQEQIKVERDFLEVSKEILGPKVLKEVPEGLLTDAYNP